MVLEDVISICLVTASGPGDQTVVAAHELDCESNERNEIRRILDTAGLPIRLRCLHG